VSRRMRISPDRRPNVRGPGRRPTRLPMRTPGGNPDRRNFTTRMPGKLPGTCLILLASSRIRKLSGNCGAKMIGQVTNCVSSKANQRARGVAGGEMPRAPVCALLRGGGKRVRLCLTDNAKLARVGLNPSHQSVRTLVMIGGECLLLVKRTRQRELYRGNHGPYARHRWSAAGRVFWGRARGLRASGGRAAHPSEAAQPAVNFSLPLYRSEGIYRARTAQWIGPRPARRPGRPSQL
jgi:hypothetical protein